jgi:hypothetical protein
MAPSDHVALVALAVVLGLTLGGGARAFGQDAPAGAPVPVAIVINNVRSYAPRPGREVAGKHPAAAVGASRTRLLGGGRPAYGLGKRQLDYAMSFHVRHERCTT